MNLYDLSIYQSYRISFWSININIFLSYSVIYFVYSCLIIGLTNRKFYYRINTVGG